MRLSRRDGSMACQRRSGAIRGASLCRRRSWAYANTLDFSRPGKPTDNASVESYGTAVSLTGPSSCPILA